jgi:molecular chaperone DnaJ
MSFADPYKALGVAYTADYDTIKKTYYKLAKELHPDVNKNPDAEQKFKHITAAWNVLSDHTKKADFDDLIYGRRSPRTQDEMYAQYSISRKLRGMESFTNMQMNRNKPPKPGSSKGQALQIKLPVSPIDIILGETIVVDYERLEPCKDCGGRGADIEECHTCGGYGSHVSSFMQGPFQFNNVEPCLDCHTLGYKKQNLCHSCNGTGTSKALTSYSINLSLFPREIDPSSNPSLCIPDGGNYGNNGGQPGELVILPKFIFPDPTKVDDQTKSLLLHMRQRIYT